MLTIDMKSFFRAHALGNTRVLVHGLVGRLRENLVDVILFIKTFKTMRHNLTIRERMLRAFAAVMRTVFPTWAVKYYTLKEKRHGHGFTLGYDYEAKARLFLPGPKKELKAIKKLDLSSDATRQRVWSPETEMALLKLGNFVLVSNIKSSNTEALNIVCATNNAELIAKVFTNSTPSATYLKDWLKKTDESVVVDVIKRVPTVFNDLHYEDIDNLKYISAFLNSALDVDPSKQVKNAAKKWAEEVITRKEYMNCLLASKPEMAELFDSAMSVLIRADYNFTRYMEMLELRHKKWYGNIRDHADFSAYIEDYLIERLPKVWFMAKTEGVRTFARLYGYEMTDKQDAASWMTLTRKFIDRPRVAIAAMQTCSYLGYGNPDEVVVDLQKALVEGISTFHVAEVALEKLPQQYRWQVQAKLYDAINTADEAKKAFKLLPKSYRKGLRGKLVEKTVQSDANLLLSYWPFAGWEAETAEKAVRKLAGFKALPMAKLSELPENLQRAGIEELETLSEISAIGRSYCGDLQKDLMKQKFHSRSEAYLFQLDYNWQELKALYISNNEMEEASFRVLVNFKGTGYGGDEGRIAELIRLHAKTWGLTEREYKDLMQSPYYSAMAADLKKHCKSAEPVNEEQATIEVKND